MRRYSRAFREDDFPDLTVIDGGKGQLGIARRVFDELGVNGWMLSPLLKVRKRALEMPIQKESWMNVYLYAARPIQLS